MRFWIAMIVTGVTAVFLIEFLTGCGGRQGPRGEPGKEGEIIFPPGSSSKVLTKCEYKWDEMFFKYKTVYQVWQYGPSYRRISGICNTRTECKPGDYVRKEYPVDAAGYSRAEVTDGLVTAWLVGTKAAQFKNQNGTTIDAICQIEE